MNKTLLLITLLCLWGCAKEPVCIIEGELPDVRSFENERIYLVPMENATAETVDSCIVTNGTFRFERSVKDSGMFILRTRPLLRLTLQEILVVVEPGRLEVKLGAVSSAKGTPANNALQQWKEQKNRTDEEYANLNGLLQRCEDSIQRKDIQSRMEMLRNTFSGYNYTFVEENKENSAGRFVYRMIFSSLSEEQIEALHIR